MGSGGAGSLGWGGGVSNGKYAKPERQGRLGRRWSYFLCWTKLLKMGAEPLGGRWGFREWGVIGAWPQGVANPVYLSLLSACIGSAMALKRVFLLRSVAPRVAALSTKPQAQEQPPASPEALRGCGAAKAVRPPVPAVDFTNTQEAYRSRRSWELVRNLLVLRLCASPVLLAHHEQVRGWVGDPVGRSGARTLARPAGDGGRKCRAGPLKHGLKLGRQGRGPFPAYFFGPHEVSYLLSLQIRNKLQCLRHVLFVGIPPSPVI